MDYWEYRLELERMQGTGDGNIEITQPAQPVNQVQQITAIVAGLASLAPAIADVIKSFTGGNKDAQTQIQSPAIPKPAQRIPPGP